MCALHGSRVLDSCIAWSLGFLVIKKISDSNMTTPHLYSALWCKPNTCHDSYNYPSSLWNWFSSWKWAFICICATDRMCLEWLSYSINWYLWCNLCIINHWWTNHWRACRIWFFLCSILMFLLVDCLLKKRKKIWLTWLKLEKCCLHGYVSSFIK